MTAGTASPTAGDGEPAPRELAVSPAIGPLPPIHVAPSACRSAVRLLRRAAARVVREIGHVTGPRR